MAQGLPKQGNGLSQQPAGGQFPYQRAQGQRGGDAQPDIPPADAEAQLQPGPKGCDNENQVTQGRPTPAQRSQKSIKEAQTKPQPQSLGELQGGLRRSGHPKRRRRKPPLLRGSS